MCCAGTGGFCSSGCGWGCVVVGAHGERFIGVRGCVYVVFKVLHGLWRLVWWLVSGERCVVGLKYLSVLILDKIYILEVLCRWWF